MCFLWCISCGVSICISGMGKNGVQGKADDTSSCHCHQQLSEGGGSLFTLQEQPESWPLPSPTERGQLKLPLPLRSCSHVLENGPVDGVEPVLLLDLGVGSMRNKPWSAGDWEDWIWWTSSSWLLCSISHPSPAGISEGHCPYWYLLCPFYNHSLHSNLIPFCQWRLDSPECKHWGLLALVESECYQFMRTMPRESDFASSDYFHINKGL